MWSEIVLARNEVTFDTALSSNLMKNKEQREQWLCYYRNLEKSLTLELVKLIQTATPFVVISFSMLLSFVKA